MTCSFAEGDSLLLAALTSPLYESLIFVLDDMLGLIRNGMGGVNCDASRRHDWPGKILFVLSGLHNF